MRRHLCAFFCNDDTLESDGLNSAVVYRDFEPGGVDVDPRAFQALAVYKFGEVGHHSFNDKHTVRCQMLGSIPKALYLGFLCCQVEYRIKNQIDQDLEYDRVL